MLGVGWTEMLIIGVVALIVIGPKDLPVLMQRMGKVAGSIRRMGMDFQREINKTTGLDEVRNLRNSIAAPLKKTTDEIRREFNVMTPSGVKPSGVIKPADPASESVVNEIKAAAGMPVAAAAVSAAPVEAVAPVLADDNVRIKAARPARATPATSSTVAVSDLPAVESAPKVRAVRKAPVRQASAEPSPAPIETQVPMDLAVVKPARKRPQKVLPTPDAAPATTPDEAGKAE